MPKSKADRTVDRVVVALACLALVGGLIETIQNHGDDDDDAGSADLLAKGSAAPPLAMVSHAQPQTHLSDADLRGKVVVLDFWAMWCPHCRAEAPRIRDLGNQFKAAGDVAVLAVDADPEDATDEGRGKVGAFLRAKGLEDLGVFYASPAFGVTYRASALPTLYVLDKKGVVRYAAAGERSERTLVDAVEAARKQ